jgi:hypothetical protein
VNSSPGRMPRFQYDCKGCKFNWCCGELCACMWSLPPAPKSRMIIVEKLQSIMRYSMGTDEVRKLRKKCLETRRKWYLKNPRL